MMHGQVGRKLARPAIWTLLALLFLGCDEPKAEELIEKESTVAEKHEDATLFWNVDEDGKAELVVKNSAGTMISRDLDGELKVVREGDTEPTTLTLEEHPERGVFTADLKDLDPALTTVEYKVEVEGKVVTGSLLLPAQGTAELVEVANHKPDAKNAKPEHGGTIEVIDGRRYEVVANAKSGETRVYLLDKPDDKPKSVELAVDVHESERVELIWDDEGYYVADVHVAQRPRKVSLIVVDSHSRVHVALVGLHAHEVLVVDRAPVFWTVRKWKHHGKARGHYKGTVFGPPGHYKFHDQGGKHKKHHGHEVVVVGHHDHDEHHEAPVIELHMGGKDKKGKGKHK